MGFICYILKYMTSLKKSQDKIRISVPQEKTDICREVIIYLLQEIGSRPNVSEEGLCKILYFIDFDYYEKFEEQLIGATYIKSRYGPTPAVFPELMAQMEKDGDIRRVMKKYYRHTRRKYHPLRFPDLSKLSAREKDHIDCEIERFKDCSTAKMGEYSQADVPWITADDRKPIPYESVFYRTPGLSVRQYDYSV